MTQVGTGGLNLLCLFHLIASGAWLVAVASFHNRVSWFFSGALVFTHVALGLLVGTRIMGILMLRLLHRVRIMHPTIKLNKKLRPSVWPREAAIGLLVMAVLSLVFLACYMSQIIYAKVHPTGSADFIVRQLAEGMWHTEAAVPIVALVMISLTMVLHVADIVVASVVIYESNHEEPPPNEDMLRVLDPESGNSSSSVTE